MNGECELVQSLHDDDGRNDESYLDRPSLLISQGFGGSSSGIVVGNYDPYGASSRSDLDDDEVEWQADPIQNLYLESPCDHDEYINEAAADLMKLLPPEIHYIILTFVDFQTLLTCQLVSKQWYNYSIRSEIWMPFYGRMMGTLGTCRRENPKTPETPNSNSITLSEFTIFDKNGFALVPRQPHLSEDYLAWMLQERDPTEDIKLISDFYQRQSRRDSFNNNSDEPSFRSLFLNKAVQNYDKKNRKRELIDMYTNLNGVVQYLPYVKQLCYWFFTIGILIFSLVFPTLLDERGKLKPLDHFEKWYTLYVLICFGPVLIGHALCLALCYWVYRKHTNLSYHEQGERLLIFSMTNVTSYLLDVTFETQLLCSIPLVFCIPIIMYIFDWGHTVSMLPTIACIVAQKFFYFVYEVNREKLLRRTKWETFRAINTVLIFQVSLICFKLDGMLLLRYIFGDIVMNLTWTLAFIPAYLFGFIHCTNSIHQLQKRFLFSYHQKQNTHVTRKTVMFVGCLVFYLIFFFSFALKLDKPEKVDFSFVYIFAYWYCTWILYGLLKRDRFYSHLFLN